MSAENKTPTFDPTPYFIKAQGGKIYLPVAPRVAWLRADHPEWTILTESVALDMAAPIPYAIFLATIMDEGGRILATATKYEDRKGFGDFIEKAETGSVGRAILLCGYGTLQAQELDEGERIADAPQPDTRRGQQTARPAPTPLGESVPKIDPKEEAKQKALKDAQKAFMVECHDRGLDYRNDGVVSLEKVGKIVLEMLADGDAPVDPTSVSFGDPATWSIALDRLKKLPVDPFLPTDGEAKEGALL